MWFLDSEKKTALKSAIIYSTLKTLQTSVIICFQLYGIKFEGDYTRMLWAILNTQNNSCTATYHLLQKLPKLDEPEIQDTAGEVGTNL